MDLCLLSLQVRHTPRNNLRLFYPSITIMSTLTFPSKKYLYEANLGGFGQNPYRLCPSWRVTLRFSSIIAARLYITLSPNVWPRSGTKIDHNLLIPPKVKRHGKKNTDKTNKKRSRNKIGVHYQDSPDDHRFEQLAFFAIHKSYKPDSAENGRGDYPHCTKTAYLKSTGIRHCSASILFFRTLAL